MVRKKANYVECEMSSGNVFVDLGIENPDEELTKAKLAWEIEQIIQKNQLTQKEAAKIMGINQPKVSALIRRKLGGFSVERLIHFLNELGQDIDIVVKPKPAGRKSRINVFSNSNAISSTIPMAAKGKIA
ncbi:MAG: helix-turn-helix domain-containing protein [Parachlamydia sp.]|nr:helix-turn-helix domain-containing protein [Parachlamydia sp.]